MSEAFPAAADFDVLVIGAGPAGLVAAILARKAGAATALLAPPAEPRDRRTIAMLGVSVDILKEAGVFEAVADESAPLRTMRLVDSTRRLIRAPLVEFHANEIGRDAFGYNVPHAALVAALEEAAAEAGVHRIEGIAASIETEADVVRVVTVDGTALTARLIGAADGRHSPARKAAGIGTRTWSYPQSALVVNTAHELPHDDVSTEFHTETGPFTLVPLPGRRSAIVCVEKPAEAQRLAGLDDAALAREFERRAHHLVGRMTIDGKRQVFPLSGLQALKFAAHRIALIGEAAHVFPPIGAQGLNLGLRDAAVFAAVIGAHPRDPGSADALAAYDRRRTGDVTLRTSAVDALNRTLLTSLLPVQLARGIGLFALDRVPALKRAAMRQALAPHL